MAGHFPPPSSSSLPTSTLEIGVSCKKLKDRDVLSKSDPICVLFEQRQGHLGQGWVELGRTERVKNSLNPSWHTKFTVDFRFEERQNLKFEVYDLDSKAEKLDAHDFLGRLECSLGSIVSAPGRQFVSIIKDGPSKGGQFVITAEELTANKDVAHLTLSARNVDKKDTFGKSDPYFVVSKASSNGQFAPVLKSDVVKNTLNPDWAAQTVSVRDICNGDLGRTLKVDVFDWDQGGQHDLIGSFSTSLKALQEAAANPGKSFDCINPKKQGKKSYKHSGQVLVRRCLIESVPSFVDFIQGGTDLNFSVAVDFTASNGNPNDHRSLHFRNPHGDNQYMTAIKAVGEIIQDYDADKHFPALGFGAKIPPHGQVSHEFFLNLRQDSPFCAGVDGILQAYYTSLQHVTLYGPTNFSPVVNHVAKFAAAYQDGRQYFVLLVITDGIITDMEETKAAIAAASQLPMSVIIVGVGDEDFASMRELDADKGSGLSGAARDIVQFVEMRRFVGVAGGASWDRAALAKEVLAEVPQQLVEWMRGRGIKPVRA